MLICNLRSQATSAAFTTAKHSQFLLLTVRNFTGQQFLGLSVRMAVSDSFDAPLLKVEAPAPGFVARRSSANNKHKQFIVGALANKTREWAS